MNVIGEDTATGNISKHIRQEVILANSSWLQTDAPRASGWDRSVASLLLLLCSYFGTIYRKTKQKTKQNKK